MTSPTEHPADPTAGPGFTRRSVIRSCCAEPVIFMGGQRALLMQIAHPAIAQGVDDHSTFRQLPVSRLWKTADTMLCMVWGSDSQAAAAHREVMAIHDRVNGSLPEPGYGPEYTAHDPEALAWVWGTLVETTYQVHERWLRPLGERWEHLYADWRRFGLWFGLRDDQLPSTTSEFRPWYSARLDEVHVTDEARELARSILEPPIWFAPRSVKRTHALLTTGLLDAKLRHDYGLPWDDQLAATFDRMERQIRVTHAMSPDFRRSMPRLYVTARRAVLPG